MWTMVYVPAAGSQPPPLPLLVSERRPLSVPLSALESLLLPLLTQPGGMHV
jgi:hypothetical protein